MASLMTRGFTTSGLTGQYTPVDPRYAVADPFAFSKGLNQGLADMQAIEADALFRQDRPRQQLLRDIELAQAQAEMSNMPRVNRLKDLEFAAKERTARLADLAPEEYRSAPRTVVNEFGNEDTVYDVTRIDPITGAPRTYTEVYSGKTKEEREAPIRAMNALAERNVAYGEAAIARANNPTVRTTMKSSVNAQNQIVDQWFAPDGTPVTDPTLRLGPDGQPLIARSTGGGAGYALENDPSVINAPSSGTGTPAPTSGIKTGGTVVAPPAPAKITGTQAPANAVPGIDTPFNLNIPKGSFPTIDAANTAVANGMLQVEPGDIVLINGVPLKWVDGP